MKKKRANQKEIDLEKDIKKLEKRKKSQEDCMIMNGKKAGLKAIHGGGGGGEREREREKKKKRELKVYYYILRLDG